MVRHFILALPLLLALPQGEQGLLVESTAFANKHYIPYRYTCDGENESPGFRITRIPGETKSLAMIMIDSSAAFGEFDHWILWNLPVTGIIEQNRAGGITGRNSRKENKYIGPCPPNGIHEYRFRVYALDAMLNIADTNGKQGLIKAMKGHIISKGELVGLFQRQE